MFIYRVYRIYDVYIDTRFYFSLDVLPFWTDPTQPLYKNNTLNAAMK